MLNDARHGDLHTRRQGATQGCVYSARSGCLSAFRAFRLLSGEQQPCSCTPAVPCRRSAVRGNVRACARWTSSGARSRPESIGATLSESVNAAGRSCQASSQGTQLVLVLVLVLFLAWLHVTAHSGMYLSSRPSVPGRRRDFEVQESWQSDASLDPNIQ